MLVRWTRGPESSRSTRRNFRRSRPRSLFLDCVEKLSDLGDYTFGVLLHEVVATWERRLPSVGRQLQPVRLVFLCTRRPLRCGDDPEWDVLERERWQTQYSTHSVDVVQVFLVPPRFRARKDLRSFL